MSRSELACTLRVQVNLDGYALPIKKLKGTEPVESLHLSGKKLGVASTIVIASLISVNGSLTALDLSVNELKDEGVSAVCEAIQSNKETKLTSLNFGYNGIGPVGANAVAAMVAVTGLLTSIKLRGNKLGGEGWGAIFAAICGNKDSKIISMDASSEDIGPAGVKLIAEALRTSVTGVLTSIDLSSNQLCGLNWEGRGIYTTVGMTAIADALRVNGLLTSLDLSNNKLCGMANYGGGTYTAEGITVIADALRVNGSLTEVR